MTTVLIGAAVNAVSGALVGAAWSTSSPWGRWLLGAAAVGSLASAALLTTRAFGHH